MIGKMDDSRIRSAPAFSLRGREKFGSAMDRAIDPTTIREPGPGHYQPRVVNPNEMIAPKHAFAKSSHPKEKPRLAPGPGAYKLPAAVGKQPLSTKRSETGTGFGKGQRPQLLLTSAADVGPGEYGRGVAACGNQPDSRKLSAPRSCLLSGRDSAPIGARMNSDMVPGPGQYHLPSGMCGKGSSYPYRAAPHASMSGRNKFGSPF